MNDNRARDRGLFAPGPALAWCALACFFARPLVAQPAARRGEPWPRHVIDNSSRGADGDLDVLACEESQPIEGPGHGLGVFWYENPATMSAAGP